MPVTYSGALHCEKRLTICATRIGLRIAPTCPDVFIAALTAPERRQPMSMHVPHAAPSKKFEDAHSRYKIRVFEGEHGWAPPEVWDEALNWMDLQAMVSGTLPRDATQIKKSFDERMARAKQLATLGDILESAREYQSVIRDFSSLTDVASAREQLAAS